MTKKQVLSDISVTNDYGWLADMNDNTPARKRLIDSLLASGELIRVPYNAELGSGPAVAGHSILTEKALPAIKKQIEALRAEVISMHKQVDVYEGMIVDATIFMSRHEAEHRESLLRRLANYFRSNH